MTQPYVHEWYDKDKENSLEKITKRYGPKIKGEKPTDCYLVLYEEKPVASIQTYKVNDWPEFGNYLGMTTIPRVSIYLLATQILQVRDLEV